jgi:D-alanyl-D-alanine carboxypeptidase
MKTLCRTWLPQVAVVASVFVGPSIYAQAVAEIAPDLQTKIDAAVTTVLHDTGVPSASIAVVQGGKLIYSQAYGKGRLQPELDASPAMRYSIGSISKQFTAAALLLLQEQGKLSLDDKVSKYLPQLTRANEVTLRMLLSHTSGYQDYWPEDYVMPPMLQPISSDEILKMWAQKPLDFDPGTRWQYSNTNYVIAGRIVEQVSGMPIMEFLKQHIFVPLQMSSVYNTDEARLTSSDANGYYRHALGPLRPAPKEGRGWMFAAGELAMTAHDLGLWDVSLIHKSILKPESYAQMFTDVKLTDGKGSGYGLGVQVEEQQGHSLIEHTGEASGFVSDNIVLPENGVAVAVLTNQDAVSAASQIAHRMVPVLLGDAGSTNKAEQQAADIFAELQKGKIDRTLFTSNCNAYFSEEALQDFSTSLGPLGPLRNFHQVGEALRGGMTFRSFQAEFQGLRLNVTVYEMPDGKLEQYLVEPAR